MNTTQTTTLAAAFIAAIAAVDVDRLKALRAESRALTDGRLLVLRHALMNHRDAREETMDWDGVTRHEIDVINIEIDMRFYEREIA